MLSSEWDTDNGYAKQCTKNNMNKRSVQATGKYPDYVEQDSKTSAAAIGSNYFFTKGHQNQYAILKH